MNSFTGSEIRQENGSVEIIPSNRQLIHLLEEIQNKCIEFNKDVLDYDYQTILLMGALRNIIITLSAKGIHFAPTAINYFFTGFDSDFEGEFVTSLTQAIHPSAVVSEGCGIGPARYGSSGFALQHGARSMVLNAFAHAAGLEVGGGFFNVSDPQVVIRGSIFCSHVSENPASPCW